MKPTLWLLMLALQLARCDPDWSSCPTVCTCKWVSGKKAAECTSQGLTTVPDSLSPEIQSIDLSNNTIQSLPSGAFKVVGLINLQKIFLRGCGIQELHKDTFKTLQLLIELDLSNNRIHYIHSETFRDNVNLRVLLIHHNPLTKLEDGLFTNMTYLHIVDLNDCNLLHISQKIFVNVPALHHLHLAGNKLTQIEVATFESLDRLTSLVLHNNPWRCDCYLKAFRNWSKERKLDLQPTACADPPKLAGRLWTDIAFNDFDCSPKIVYPDKDMSIEVDDEEITLSCKANGNPPPEVFWVVHSRITSNSTNASYDASRYTIREGGGWANLTIAGLHVQDRKEYTCVAKSPGGVDERNTLVVPPGADRTQISRLSCMKESSGN